MKPTDNRLRAITAVIVVIAIAWWLLPGAKSHRHGENPETNAAPILSPPSQANNLNEAEPNLTGTPPNPPVSIDRQIEMTRELEQNKNDWRTPIEFYGKVIDENSNAVQNSEIEFSCNDVSETGTSHYHRTSDAAGLFTIRDIKGKLLNVNVSKEGYYNSVHDNRYFTYSGENVNFVPDARNPVIFHLRKRGNAEALIVKDIPGFAKIAQVRRDGTPVRLDLIKGTTAAAGSGNITLEMWADPSAPGVSAFNWKFRLTMLGGGLIETDDEFNFTAPEKGYGPSLMIEMPASEADWQNEIRRKLFFQLPDGTFGRIEIYLLARNGVYTIQSFINPSGSRNLEYDPNSVIQSGN